jgi:DNA (cytosine-5)-methyltransferase 1
MVGIDLFAGAGGMSLGAINAGIRVALAIESDPHAAVTYRRNHPHTLMLARDIRSIDVSQVRGIKNDNDGTILFGGPPCQGFSYSNSRTRKRSNANNWLFLEFIRIAKAWEPDWVVFENVKGITDTAGGIFLERVIGLLDELNYSVAHGVLDAARFGVPQHRQRLFVVASRLKIEPTLPGPLLEEPPTVEDAIGDLPYLQNGSDIDWRPYRRAAVSSYAKSMRGRLNRCSGHVLTKNAEHIISRYRHIPQGGNWEDVPLRLMNNYSDRTRCHTGIYHRLPAKEPSIVIGNYRKNMLIHPRQNRGLSVREAARIQSFPDWYQFEGSVGFQQQQVGNAVPPLLSTAVFKHIIKLGKYHARNLRRKGEA